MVMDCKKKLEASFLQVEFTCNEHIFLLRSKVHLMKHHWKSATDFAVYIDARVRA